MKKLSVMVSGGVDSFIAYRKAIKENRFEKVTPIYVDINAPYKEKELIALNKLIPETLIIPTTLCSKILNINPTIENQEIYGRNLLFAFYGSFLGDVVWLSALETEMNEHAVADKRPEFFYLTSGLLSYVFKNLRKDIRVETPFSEFTKSDIIEYGLREKLVTKEELEYTSTCYSDMEHNCGKCSTCFKRWIAMVNNNIFEKYVNPPYKSNYAINIIKKIRLEIENNVYSGRFTKKRIEETRKALKKVDIEL